MDREALDRRAQMAAAERDMTAAKGNIALSRPPSWGSNVRAAP
jgi:hypothetical protein